MHLDPVRVTASIAAMMQNAGAKLTEKQEILLAGSLAVWLEKAHDNGAHSVHEQVRHLQRNGVIMD